MTSREGIAPSHLPSPSLAPFSFPFPFPFPGYNIIPFVLSHSRGNKKDDFEGERIALYYLSSSSPAPFPFPFPSPSRDIISFVRSHPGGNQKYDVEGDRIAPYHLPSPSPALFPFPSPFPSLPLPLPFPFPGHNIIPFVRSHPGGDQKNNFEGRENRCVIVLVFDKRASLIYLHLYSIIKSLRSVKLLCCIRAPRTLHSRFLLSFLAIFYSSFLLLFFLRYNFLRSFVFEEKLEK